jgi:phenolic acid decarboxylase
MDVMTIDGALHIMVVGALWGLGLELTLSLMGAAIYKVLRACTQ